MKISELIKELEEWQAFLGKNIEVRVLDMENAFDAPIHDVQFEVYGNDEGDRLSIRI